jgi:hypothetical protein
MTKALIILTLFCSLPALAQRNDRLTGKTKVFIFASVPYLNTLHTKPPTGARTGNGFVGISAGAGYHHKPRRFYTWQAGALMDFPVPMPAPIHYGPDTAGHIIVESTSSIFTSFRNNHVWGRFDLGYGPMLSRHVFNRSDEFRLNGADTTILARYENWGLGASLSGYFRFSRAFGLGILYQPQFISFNHGPRYEHTASVDLRILFKRRTKAEILQLHEQERQARKLKEEAKLRERELKKAKKRT